jgi:ribonuclease HII
VSNVNKAMSNRVNYILVDGYKIPYLRYIINTIDNDVMGNIRLSETMVDKNMRRKSFKHKNTKFDIAESTKCQTAIVKGDQISISIAAASIVAKVYRDDLMIKLSKISNCNIYQWDKNKGYGTIKHERSIATNGATFYHRRHFLRKIIVKGRK